MLVTGSAPMSSVAREGLVSMDELPTLFVCDGDDQGPRFHPCRRVQEALSAAGIDYDKVIAGHGHRYGCFAKGHGTGCARRPATPDCRPSSSPTARSSRIPVRYSPGSAARTTPERAPASDEHRHWAGAPQALSL
jgi:hypothetical protein